MRVTFVLPLLEASGGARIVVGHAERLAERGHTVVIVAPRRERPNMKQRLKQILLGRAPEYTPVGQTHVGASQLEIFTPDHPGKVLEHDVPDADVIIATWWETAEWISTFSPRKGTKIHFIQHYEAFAPMPATRVDAVWRLPYFKIAIAQWLIDLGRERFALEMSSLVPNSIEDRFRATTPHRKQSIPTIGFLYHNADFKDFGTTAAVIKRLKIELPHVRLLSFGSTQPTVDEMPRDVEFHRLPSQEKIARIYADCDVWLSTSLTEGFNLPPLEAMGSGCPAVCSKTGRPMEVILDGVNGYLVDQGNIDGFVDGIIRILDLSPEAYREMSTSAMAAVAHPTWSESSKLFEDALQRAAERAGQ